MFGFPEQGADGTFDARTAGYPEASPQRLPRSDSLAAVASRTFLPGEAEHARGAALSKDEREQGADYGLLPSPTNSIGSHSSQPLLARYPPTSQRRALEQSSCSMDALSAPATPGTGRHYNAPPTWCDRSSPTTAKPPMLATMGQVARRFSTSTLNSKGNSTPRESGRSIGSTQNEQVGNVSVCLRLRPTAASAEEPSVALSENPDAPEHIRSVRLRTGRPETPEVAYHYDNVFGMDCSQDDVYQDAVAPICEGVIKGYNGAVIAYGQTGSGKTYTMLGNTKSRGIAPRAISEIFAALEKHPSCAIEVSVLEIYNERVRDLLAPGTAIRHVDIHETSSKNHMAFRCPDATRRRVESPEEALLALSEGMKRRETARTDMNHNSSRSHLIFTMEATQRDDEVGAVLRGRLHLVDLAGSERLKRSMSTEGFSAKPRQTGSAMRSPRDQRREAGEINKSLSQLALVIQRLTSGNQSWQMVPYRDSMLTRLLAESFGGSSKTCLIINCSPLQADREETRSSLEFGKRAKLVRNCAEINLEVAHAPSMVMQAYLRKEMENLQRQRDHLLQERDLMIEDQERTQAQLRHTEALLQEAATDVLAEQDRRDADVARLEEQKAAIQTKWIAAAEAAQSAYEASAAETARVQANNVELHKELLKTASDLANSEQERVREVSRSELLQAQLKEQGAECADIRTKRMAALDDVARLENEKTSLVAKLAASEQERRLEAVRCERVQAEVKEQIAENATLKARRTEEVMCLEQQKAALSLELEGLRCSAQPLEHFAPSAADLAARARRAMEEAATSAAHEEETQAEVQRQLEEAAQEFGRQEEVNTAIASTSSAESSEVRRKWEVTSHGVAQAPEPTPSESIPEEDPSELDAPWLSPEASCVEGGGGVMGLAPLPLDDFLNGSPAKDEASDTPCRSPSRTPSDSPSRDADAAVPDTASENMTPAAKCLGWDNAQITGTPKDFDFAVGVGQAFLARMAATTPDRRDREGVLQGSTRI